MIKVILTYYPLSVNWNHGVSLLAEICRKEGIRCIILPLAQNFISQVQKHQPDYIGFSFVTAEDYYACLNIALQVKSMGIKTLAGGVYAKMGAHIDPAIFDYTCLGEGERIADFLSRNDETALTGHFQENIDDLPLPDYSNITGLEFNRPQYGYSFLNRLKIIPYSSSRGCPYDCSFCGVQLYKRPVRIKHTIKNDLDLLMDRHNPDLFYITDELMPYYNSEWLSQWKGNKHHFFGLIRADIKKETLGFLIDNGMKFCAFGIESGDEEYRNNVLKKGLKDDDIYRTVAILKANNIIYSPFFMSGTPYETEEIKSKTDKMLNDLGGWTVTFPYNDLRRRVFTIPDLSIDRYCKKTGTNKAALLSSLNNPAVSVISNEHGFVVYEIMSNVLYIREIYGDGAYWFENVFKELVKSRGYTAVRGHVKRPDGFYKKRGCKYISTLVERRY